MTLRRIIISFALSGAIATGAIAVPATAGASPSVASAPGYVKTGRDPLAVYADSAMNAYMRFVESGGGGVVPGAAPGCGGSGGESGTARALDALPVSPAKVTWR